MIDRGMVHTIKETGILKHPSKLLNFALNEISYRLKSDMCLGSPRSLFIEPTNSCNLRCLMCPTGTGNLNRAKANMSFQEFKKICDEIRSSLLRLIFAGYGEPFLNEDTHRMLAYANKIGVYTEVYTNLLMLDELGLKSIIKNKVGKIIISIDSATEETYLKYKRTGSLAKTLNKIRLLSALKRESGSNRPEIKLSYVAMKHNYKEIPRARELAKTLGIDSFVVKSVNLKIAGKDFNHMKTEYDVEEFSRYKDVPRQKTHCVWPYGGGLIYANGDFVPCCYIARGEHVMGNVFENSVAEVWNGKQFRNFRHQLVHEPNSLAVCSTCLAKYEGHMG